MRTWYPVALALASVAVVVAVSGCTTRQSATTGGPLPLITLSPVGAAPDKDLKDIPIQIASSAFERDIYEVQPGDLSLLIRTQGGPYLFRIDQLVDPRELPADSETRVLLNVTNPGRYTMHVALSTPTDATAREGTATLDVRPVGSR